MNGKKLAAALVVLFGAIAASPTYASWRPSIPRPSIPRPSIPPITIPTRPPEIRLPDPRKWFETSDNIEQKRQDLRREFRAVILGKHINHAEYVRFGSAIAAAVATENPAPVIEYLKTVVLETKRDLMRNGNAEAQRVAQAFTKEMLAKMLDAAYRGQRPQLYQFRGVKVRVGFVTYAHWKRVVTEYPYLSAGRIKWRKDENRVSLPNTHQIYVGIDF